MLPLFALSLVGCAPPPYNPADTAGGNPGDTGSQDIGLDIGFAWPANETAVTGCVTVVVNYSGVTLTDPMAHPEPADGEGHYHVLFDDYYALCTAPYCLVDFKNDPEEDPDGLQGAVVLTAQLMDNAHAPILDDEGNTVTDTLLVNVAAGECAEGSGSGQ